MVVNGIHRRGAAAAAAALVAACAMPPGGVPAAPSGWTEPGGEYLVFIDAGKPSVQLQFASAADCQRWALNMAEAGQGAPGTQAPRCVGQNSAATLPVAVALRKSPTDSFSMRWPSLSRRRGLRGGHGDAGVCDGPRTLPVRRSAQHAADLYG